MPADSDHAFVDSAVSGAAAAFPRFAASAAVDRAQLLRALADCLETQRAPLVRSAAAETQLADGRLNAELSRTTWQLQMFADFISGSSYPEVAIDAADPSWPAGGRPDLRRMLVPVGPVLVFSAVNFPFAFSVAGTDTASALAAGCPVIVKTHPGHPELSHRTREALAPVLDGGSWPATLLTLIDGQEAGVQALQHPDLAAAAFTGSTAGGRALFDIATSRPRPIPFYGELGSLNPVFITAAALNARRSEIVEGLLASYTLGAGQFCTKPGLVAIPAGEGVEHDLAALAGSLPQQVLLNDHIATGYERSSERLLAIAGVTTLLSPGSGATQAPALAVVTAARFLEASDAMQSECFGPLTLLVTYDDDGDLLEIARRLDGQLTATVHSELGEQVVRDLVVQLAAMAGRIIHNGWPTGVAVTAAMTHGGPYPAATTAHTSVGTAAIHRFLRPVTYQNFPDELLPPALTRGASTQSGAAT